MAAPCDKRRVGDNQRGLHPDHRAAFKVDFARFERGVGVNPYLVADVLALGARLFCGATVRVAEETLLDAHSAGQQRVYLANHSSHLDFIVIWAALPTPLRRVTRPVAAHDYWSKTALRRYLATQVYRAILIEREHVSAANNPIEQMIAAMGEEFSLILFPEGTRGRGGEVGEFKSGIYHLAHHRPGLKCVPVYLENLNRILPKGEVLPLPLLSSVSLGTPMQLQDGEKKSAFLLRLREAVSALKSE